MSLTTSHPAPDSPLRPVAVVVLAAGQGTRMRSALPKVLHPIGGAPMLHHALRAGLSLAPERLAVVVGGQHHPGGEAVAEAARALVPDAEICTQVDQLGTGHAVAQAAPALAGFTGDLFVLYGDTPFLGAETLTRMRAARAAGADLVALGFETEDPAAYGRMVAGPDDTLERIVEARDATAAEREIRTCNSGILAGDAAMLLGLIGRVGCENAKGEYYLTDVVALARAEGLTARLVRCDAAETVGVNDRVELAAAEAAFQARARRAAMLAGTSMVAPETVFLSFDSVLGRDVTLGPNVVLGPGVEIGDGAEIRAFSHLEGCRVAAGAVVGPFARLRPGAEIGAGAHVGNFVEIKNAVMGAGAKANHLSYLGDAQIGAGANLGAGTITCNYDGFAKHRTRIGAGAFIGVNTALIAPVSVGDNAYVGTGTVLTRDVPAEALALARTPQTIREGYARRLRARLAARAAEKKS